MATEISNVEISEELQNIQDLMVAFLLDDEGTCNLPAATRVLLQSVGTLARLVQLRIPTDF